jgi:hypothetical protein
MRALARKLQQESSISDGASLLALQEQATEHVREPKRRDNLQPDEPISAVRDAVARDSFSTF